MKAEEVSIEDEFKATMIEHMRRESWVMMWFRRFQFTAYGMVILACLKYLSTH